MLDKNDYVEALAFCRRAIEHEPDNADYWLDLAELYTELNYYDESNEILFDLMRRNAVDVAECLFGLGCNYMGLQDYEKAEESFQKYLDVEPDGVYADEAEDMMLMIDGQREWEYGGDSAEQLDEETEQQIEHGRLALDRGDYTRAITLLEGVLVKHPRLIYVRNNLALAYFYGGQKEKAMAMAEATYARERDNVHACCNLALFYRAAGRVGTVAGSLTVRVTA